MGVPQARWMVKEKSPSKIMMIWGYPYDSGNLHMAVKLKDKTWLFSGVDDKPSDRASYHILLPKKIRWDDHHDSLEMGYSIIWWLGSGFFGHG